MPEDKLEVSQRVTTLLTQGQNPQARAEIENLLRDWPGDAEVFTLAGDVYAWTGAPSTAYRHYNSAADTYNRLGMPDKMLSVHHKILELDPSLLDANTQLRIRLLELLVAAEDALIAGKYDASVASYQEAIRQFPNHTVTYQRLASLFTRMGRPADAVLQYLTVARAFQQHGVTAKAAPYFERVLEIEPSNIEAVGAVLAFLEKEGRMAEAERPVKAAVQSFLERGDVDHASEFFQRLPEAVQQDVTPLRAALLLQMGDVQQADDAASMLELGRPEIADWFKRMGRASLDRGDSVTADVYFRWASPQAAAPAEQPAPQAVAAPAPAPQFAPQPMAVPAPPPPQFAQPMAAPAPPPPQFAPQPMAAPAPPPPQFAPQPMAAPAPAPPQFAQPMAAPAPPPPQFVPQPVAAPAPPPVPVAPPPPPPAAPAPAPLVQFVAPLKSDAIDIKAEDDRVVLQTMGEMCLAEEMFEEAKQVFERLLRAEPHRKGYLELLNKSRAGLGLGPVTGPPPPPGAIPPPPPSAMAAIPAPPPAPAAAATSLGAPAFQAPVLAPAPVIAPPPAPAPVVMAPAPPPPPAPAPVAVAAPPPPAPAPVAAAPAPPPPPPVPAPVAVAPPPPPAPAPAAPAPAPAHVRPELEPMGIRVNIGPSEGGHMPKPSVEWAPPPPGAPFAQPEVKPAAAPAPAPAPVPAPVRKAPAAAPARVPVAIGAGLETPDGSKIVRTSHTVQLGELPPATSTKLDFDDDIIE